MDEVQAALTPASEPAGSGRMSLADSVKSAVRSSLETERASKISDAPSETDPVAAADTDPMAPLPGDQPPAAPQDAKDGATPAASPEQAAPTPAAPEAPAASLEAPKQWSKAWKEQFAKLPPEAQQILLDRDREYNKGYTKNAQDNAEFRRRSEALTSSFQPHHREQMAQNGLDEVGAVQYLLMQHDTFNRDPVGFVATIAQQVGVDKFFPAVAARIGIKPDALAPQAQPQPQVQAADPQNEWVDPATLELRQQLAELQKQVFSQHQFLQHSTQTAAQREQAQREAQQRQREANIATEIDRFVSATDDQGNLLYPHVEDVQDKMVLLMRDPEIAKIQDYRARLEAAYKEAVYLNPAIRESVFEAQKAKALAEALSAKEAEWKAQMNAAAAAQAAQKAKTAATIKGAPGASGASRPTGRMSIDEAVRTAVRTTAR